MKDKEWVLLAMVPGAVVAEQLKEVLEAAGIPALIQGGFLEAATLVKGLAGGRFSIFVPRDLHERAREAVSGMLDDDDLAKPGDAETPRFFG